MRILTSFVTSLFVMSSVYEQRTVASHFVVSDSCSCRTGNSGRAVS